MTQDPKEDEEEGSTDNTDGPGDEGVSTVGQGEGVAVGVEIDDKGEEEEEEEEGSDAPPPEHARSNEIPTAPTREDVVAVGIKADDDDDDEAGVASPVGKIVTTISNRNRTMRRHCGFPGAYPIFPRRATARRAIHTTSNDSHNATTITNAATTTNSSMQDPPLEATLVTGEEQPGADRTQRRSNHPEVAIIEGEIVKEVPWWSLQRYGAYILLVVIGLLVVIVVVLTLGVAGVFEIHKSSSSSSSSSSSASTTTSPSSSNISSGNAKVATAESVGPPHLTTLERIKMEGVLKCAFVGPIPGVSYINKTTGEAEGVIVGYASLESIVILSMCCSVSNLNQSFSTIHPPESEQSHCGCGRCEGGICPIPK